ncbi:GCN5-related N-acetyltransferase [Desulfofarcimen acetoxidans DSM 771]|uniref:GCN5-related N-acetyltransferase n=1 Tax=Desulfofarcimen acetoxidans (strain ATCC 49208 / DSM 771 / KCTC 5769 / VKM B-1644 / 5575) TaxID=485916 RepID=C8VZ72_DESAS|nr:GNAT family N-acetyltransferase [Desulfofarcimen acetoxidans]ACV62982.1 GCN5-related N-acetyltransferase [Desulfofarcimen acetoxidans DSM 771]
MEYYFENLSNEDRKPVIDIFNHYIENSFAAYFENKVSYDFFNGFMRISEGYPRIAVKSNNGELIGFALLRPYNPIPTFRRTAVISYFIKPTHIRKGIGKSILENLIGKAKEMGIDSILASISSLNEISINFHLKNGFMKCGVLSKVGHKFGKDFDEILMQKIL